MRSLRKITMQLQSSDGVNTTYAENSHKGNIDLQKRDWNLRTRYPNLGGLAGYQSQLLLQGGVCYICHKPMTRTGRVDHDHKTNQIKGIAHSGCNSWRERRERGELKRLRTPLRNRFKQPVLPALEALRRLYDT